MLRSSTLLLGILAILPMAAGRVGDTGGRKLRLAQVNGIPDQYFIRLDDDVEDVDGKIQSLMQRLGGGDLLFEYKSGLKGFAVSSLDEADLQILESDADVVTITQVRQEDWLVVGLVVDCVVEREASTLLHPCRSTPRFRCWSWRSRKMHSLWYTAVAMS